VAAAVVSRVSHRLVASGLVATLHCHTDLAPCCTSPRSRDFHVLLQCVDGGRSRAVVLVAVIRTVASPSSRDGPVTGEVVLEVVEVSRHRVCDAVRRSEKAQSRCRQCSVWSSLRRRCLFAEARGCSSRISSPAAAACEWQVVTICGGVAPRTVHPPYSASAIRCGGGDAEGDD